MWICIQIISVCTVLEDKQYFPVGSDKIPSNRLFAQFHAPQTSQMKDEILMQLCSVRSTVRVIFATVAMGMGVDIQYATFDK